MNLALPALVLACSQAPPSSNSATTTTTATIEDTAAPLTRVYLLGGQSNMVGLGNGAALGMPYDTPHPTVTVWTNSGGWVPLESGFGYDFGPELSFGHAIQKAYPGDTILLVKFAESGTSLYKDWALNSWVWTAFDATVSNALADLTMAGVDYDLSGMLWMQGESDALEGRGASYETNLLEFIDRVRYAYAAPEMPFIIGRVTPFYGDAENRKAVREAQMTVGDTVSGAAWFDTDSMSGWDSDGHYDTLGLIDMGEAFAAAL